MTLQKSLKRLADHRPSERPRIVQALSELRQELQTMGKFYMKTE